ncbi:hypothetical protein P261_02001 [Lachnospiraceae bacterium TWA4]|nr:hypothetical protein P261_02001 [Lachnospiraceae bacterium TWA4]
MTNTKPNTPPSTPPKPPSRLPQTGLLWWPVPILACAGLVLFMIGWIIKRRGTDEK